jgi:hypothetical protein
MTYAEAMRLVIGYMIKDLKEGYVKGSLQLMLSKLQGNFVEEHNSPNYLSIIYFGRNIFTFKNKDYIEMGKEILKDKIL